jgi:dolichol-phosphate mannosyltransferase
MTNSEEKILIIVPTYDEAENILPLVNGIMSVVPFVHILFVDDNSQDGTRDKITDVSISFPDKISILEREGKMGLASAYIAGFQWGLNKDFKWICEMDADLSHRPVDLKTVFNARENADVVIGSRYIVGGGTVNWSLIRQLISQCGSFYARTILGLKINDLTGGFNLWSSSVLRKIDINSIICEGYSFQIELKYRAHLAGFKIVEAPIIFEERRAGESKMSGNIVIEAIYKVWVLLFSRSEIIKKMGL